jgi:hypothetical protein
LPERRKAAARRDEILCALARHLPPGESDSAQKVARWLKKSEQRGFPALDATISENEERLVFESWVKASTEGSLAKRIQRAFSAVQSTQAVKPMPAPAPPLVWPLGMRQRKERDSKFKLPWLMADTGGSDRLFLECIGDGNLHSVAITLAGQRIGFAPVLRPGGFIEIEWSRNPEVKRIATWGGWREQILAQESNRAVVQSLQGVRNENSAIGELQKSLAAFAAATVEQVEKVMPKDLDRWRKHLHPFQLVVRYKSDGGRSDGILEGNLMLDMERLWFLFRDTNGDMTPIQ